MNTLNEDLAPYSVAYMLGAGEWKIGNDVASLAEIRQHVFGRMVDIAATTVTSYKSDFYHDALWLASNLDGLESFTFWFAWDQNGTHIGTDAIILKFRQNAVRYTVYTDVNRWGGRDAYLRQETAFRTWGWKP